MLCRRPNRRLAWLVACVLATAALLLALPFVDFSRVTKANLERAQSAQTRAEIEAILGKPTRVSYVGPFEEALYRTRAHPWTGETAALAISYDAHQRGAQTIQKMAYATFRTNSLKDRVQKAGADVGKALGLWP